MTDPVSAIPISHEAIETMRERRVNFQLDRRWFMQECEGQEVGSKKMNLIILTNGSEPRKDIPDREAQPLRI